MGENGNMRQKVISSFIWRIAERAGVQGVGFIITLVLARLLSPDEYGIQGIIMVFITFADILVHEGFNTSLVQKYDADETDFSSAFFFNLIFSAVLYVVVFFAAPYVASYYATPIITQLLRVLALIIPVLAVHAIQQAYVIRHMLFKRFFFSTLGGTIVSAIVGVSLAATGYGVWALIAQYMTNTIIDTAILWLTVRWRPKAVFKFERLKGLLQYGWKMILSSVLQTSYWQIGNLFIGKNSGTAKLAYFTRGYQLPNMVVTLVGGSLGNVMFPAFSKEQNNRDHMRNLLQRAIRVCFYIICPALCGVAILAEPLTVALFTEKWLPAVPIMQVFCVFSVFRPIYQINREAIKAAAHSDYVLIIEATQFTLGVISLLVFSQYGILAVALSFSVLWLFCYIASTVFSRKLFQYGILRQLKDILSTLLLTGAMVCCVFFIGKLPLSPYVLLLAQIAGGAAVYFLLSLLFRVDSLHYLLDIVRQYLPRRKQGV